jgi:hypothetical protein
VRLMKQTLQNGVLLAVVVAVQLSLPFIWDTSSVTGQSVSTFRDSVIAPYSRSKYLNAASYPKTVLFKLFFFLACHCDNTKHVRVPLDTANIKAYFQETGRRGMFR